MSTDDASLFHGEIDLESAPIIFKPDIAIVQNSTRVSTFLMFSLLCWAFWYMLAFISFVLVVLCWYAWICNVFQAPACMCGKQSCAARGISWIFQILCGVSRFRINQRGCICNRSTLVFWAWSTYFCDGFQLVDRFWGFNFKLQVEHPT